MRIQHLDSSTKKNLLEDLLQRSPSSYGQYEQAVAEILNNVKIEKDKALFAYTEQFDHAHIDASNVRVTMEEIQAAYEWLIQQRDTMKPVYAGDDVIDNMISGNKALAVVYSGDGAYIMSENEDLGFLMPEEGTNLWYDAMVMTRDCENTELAYEFMDFMLRDDVAYRNTQYVGYSSPVVAAYEQAQEEDYEGIEAYVPRVGYEKDEIFRYQDTDIKKLFAELWTKVKAQ